MTTPTIEEAHPEDTNHVERAVGRPIRLNHTEHAVELPVDEEDDEEMVGVPELFKVGTASLLHSVPDHDAQSGGHNPASKEGTTDKVGQDELFNHLAGRGTGNCEDQAREVDNVGQDVDKRANDDGPSSGFVQQEILVKRNDVVEWRAAKERDEVTADR